MSAQPVRAVHLGLAFLLELCALAALAYWGAHTGDGLIVKVALGCGGPLVAAIVWGVFAAPRAPIDAPALAVAAKLVVFGAAGAGLALAGHEWLAAVFIGVVIANSVAVHRYRRPRLSTFDQIPGSQPVSSSAHE